MKDFGISKEDQATMNWKQRLLFLWFQIFPPAPERIEVKFIGYDEAEMLLRSNARLRDNYEEEWRIAPEEDLNHQGAQLRMVYIERVKLPSYIARRRIAKCAG